MKKSLTLLLAAALLLGGLAGCGPTGPSPSGASSSGASSSGASPSGEAAVSSASSGTSESADSAENQSEPISSESASVSGAAAFDIEEFASYFKRLTSYFPESGELPTIPKLGFVLGELAQNGNYKTGRYSIERAPSQYNTFDCYYIPRADIEEKMKNTYYDASGDILEDCLNNPDIPWLKEEKTEEQDFILYGIVLEGVHYNTVIESYSLLENTLTIDATVASQALTYTFRLGTEGNYLLETIAPR